MFFAVIARRRLRAKQEYARYAVSLRVFADLFVQRQNMQQIQMLTLVLVQAFDLNIKNRMARNLNPGTGLMNFTSRSLFARLMSRYC